MKTLKLLLFAVLTFLIFFAGCIVTIVDSSADITPSVFNVPAIIAAVLTVYEVVSRVIPTVKDYAPLSLVIKGLKWVSDLLNNRKPPARSSP